MIIKVRQSIVDGKEEAFLNEFLNEYYEVGKVSEINSQ